MSKLWPIKQNHLTMLSLLQSLEEVDEKLAESLIENGDQDIFAKNNVNFVHYFKHIIVVIDRHNS